MWRCAVTGLRFDRDGLIPAIVQDVHSRQVLMLAYMNEESLQKTLATGQTWFYSRSRQELWHKGATSGHMQEVKRITYACDGDALLLEVEQPGGACHTGTVSCFFHTLAEIGEVPQENFLFVLENIIAQQKINRPTGSYTAKLFTGGWDRILKKIGEEAGEVIIAAKNRDRGELIYESGDLLFHLLVLFAEKWISLADVVA